MVCLSDSIHPTDFDANQRCKEFISQLPINGRLVEGFNGFGGFLDGGSDTFIGFAKINEFMER